jgi:hypothetical protein
MKRNSFFLQELGCNSPGFLELESQKKGTQKGMHNLIWKFVAESDKGILDVARHGKMYLAFFVVPVKS